jgi:hypothetical protein
MPNASPRAAERGWAIYLSAAPRPTIEEINRRLEEEHLAPPPISERTYRHYREMANHGIRDWMRINEFDQWRKRSA